MKFWVVSFVIVVFVWFVFPFIISEQFFIWSRLSVTLYWNVIVLVALFFHVLLVGFSRFIFGGIVSIVMVLVSVWLVFEALSFSQT